MKDYKLKKKLKPILDTINRKWDQWLVRTPDGHTRMGKEIEQIEREVNAYQKQSAHPVPKKKIFAISFFGIYRSR